MPITLTSPAVNEMGVESSFMTCLHEFLAAYFNGQAHTIGAQAEAVVFPVVELKFQQSAVAQPLGSKPAAPATPGSAITAVWNEDSRRHLHWEQVNGQRQQMVTEHVSWNFWVRATGTNARDHAMRVGDLLRALLGNAAETRALGACGILHVRPGASRAVADADYVVRLMTCTATLRYPVLSQVGQLI